MKNQYRRLLVAFIGGFVEGLALCGIVILCLWVYHL